MIIDCHEFRPSPNPFPQGSTAWALHGTARDQWHWWWQMKRRERRRGLVAVARGEIGVFAGLFMVE